MESPEIDVVRKDSMFYPCLAILTLLLIMLICIVVAIIDLEAYNFGLYIILLCIVGTMLACALCIANPNACRNPTWYTNFCLLLQELYPEPEAKGRTSPEMSALRSRLIAMHSVGIERRTSEQSRLPRQDNRATFAMLAPAVHIMHQVWKGMAWVADGIDEDEEQMKTETIEQDMSVSTNNVNPKLPLIPEISVAEPTPVSSTTDSNECWNDVTL